MATAEEFFRELWRDAEGYAELRLIRSRGSPRFFVFEIPKDLGGVHAEAEKQNGKAHVYYGICLRRSAKPRDPDAKTFRREDVAIVPAVWADVDLYEKSRQSGEYVKRHELPYAELKEKIGSDIRKLTDAIPPSALIWSGAGYQVLWFLREPIALSGPEDPEGDRVEAINHAIAKQIGGDHVHNLDRILRTPDTKNIKGARPEQPGDEAEFCRIEKWNPERRYNLSDFEEKLPVAESLEYIKNKGNKAAIPGVGEPVDLYSLRLPQRLIDIIQKGLDEYIAFRRRTDTIEEFDGRDKSRSGADAYVVTELLRAGVSDQQIWDIYRDPTNGIGDKHQERGDDYLQHTIQKCRSIAEKNKDKKKEKEHPDAKKVKIEIEKFKSSQRVYRVLVTLPDGSQGAAKVGIQVVWYFSKFQMIFWDQAGRMIPNMSQKRWHALLDQCPKKLIEAPAEAKSEEAVEATIEDWLEEKLETPDSGTLQVRPGYDTEKMFFRLPALSAQLTRCGIILKRTELCEILHGLGWKDGRIKVKDKQVRGWYKEIKEQGNGHMAADLFPGKDGEDS